MQIHTRNVFPLRLLITIVFLIFPYISIYSQNESYVDQMAESCAYLESRITKVEKIDDVDYEIWKKSLTQGTLSPIENVFLGSGFFVRENGLVYLVTAEHVARATYQNCKVRVKAKTDNYLEFDFKEVALSEWVILNESDVAIVGIQPNIELNNKLDLFAIPVNMLESELVAPQKNDEVNSLGFPLGLGADDFSPISLSSHPASSLITQRRADNNQKSTFFILDSPSIPGLSGGPVISKLTPPLGVVNFATKIKVIGLVHGVKSDNTGGKLSLIVPSYFILKALSLIPKYTGNVVIKYDNGNVWTERIYKNGLLMEVLFNKSIDGSNQEKGTIKKGNGTMLIYDKSSNLVGEFHVKNGIMGEYILYKKDQ
jgi:hypothetical protein